MIDTRLVEEAATRIREHVRATPVIAVQLARANTPVELKLESMQHTGSFKVRGAFNKLLSSTIGEAGVIAASGGNHGLAVAHAAKTMRVPVEIFVPSLISNAKLDRLRGMGAAVTVAGDDYAAALNVSRERAAVSGAVAIHAYDDPAVVAGQGTTFLEFGRQHPNLDTLLVAVGGGGLIGGAGASLGGRVNLIGVETQGTATLHAALAAGEVVEVDVSGVAADSLGARSVGNIGFALAQRHVSQVLLVTDDEVVSAMRWLWNELRVITEPGGATAMAALLAERYRPEREERVGVLICGANTDPGTFSQMIRSTP